MQRYRLGWRRKDMYTFVQLKPGTDPKKTEAKFPAIVAKYKPELKESTQKQVLGLQPLKDIHLTSDLTEEPETNGNARTVFFSRPDRIICIGNSLDQLYKSFNGKSVGKGKRSRNKKSDRSCQRPIDRTVFN